MFKFNFAAESDSNDDGESYPFIHPVSGLSVSAANVESGPVDVEKSRYFLLYIYISHLCHCTARPHARL